MSHKMPLLISPGLGYKASSNHGSGPLGILFPNSWRLSLYHSAGERFEKGLFFA